MLVKRSFIRREEPLTLIEANTLLAALCGVREGWTAESPDLMSAYAAALPAIVLTARPLRSHQHDLVGVIEAIASGQTDARDILAVQQALSRLYAVGAARACHDG